ncbi:MAG: hypothetical protein HYZ72_12000 [Deltaproteobacteria bacterium]|nr:hypothetical protein [Deltaproteobacteria bacterium]
MDTTQSLAEWARQMADTVQHRARAKEQRHQAGLLNQAQAENVWVKGMDQVVQTLNVLVQALKHTGHFPRLTLLSHARSPQGTTTYMRRGTLLSLKGLEQESPTIEFEIDTVPPFRPDLLAPTVRVITKTETRQAPGPGQEHFCFGVSLQGTVVWQLLNPSLRMSPEGNVEEMLRSFLASLLLTE